MPAAETARLIASLELQDRKFTSGVDRSIGKLGKLESRFSKLGGIASKGVSTAATNIARIGAVAVVGLTAAIKTGLDDLATLEDATTSVDGAIRKMGLAGKVTSGQVAQWANEIEASVQAAFDDKAIVAASATLLRFGKVTPDNLRPAMEVMTDLAAKTGSVESAGALLAKALADPEKAAGKLARSGAILTKQEQEQIKAFVKAGKVGEAQKVILDSLARSTEGAAAASKGPYRDAINILTDAFEDGRKALAEGFMPLIQQFAGEASEFFGNQATIARIREFGQRLADGAQAGLDFAKKIPWGAIGDGLRTAADWAGKLFDAFRSLPPDLQATIIALGGLNKLTGGAVSGIVGELGKGLIKGVLGMTAGVVHIKAATVTGMPGSGAGAGAGTNWKGILGTAISGAAVAAALAVTHEKIIMPVLQDQAGKNIGGTQQLIETGTAEQLRTSIDGLRAMPDKLDPLKRVMYDLNAQGVKVHTEGLIVELEKALAARQANDQNGRVRGGTWVPAGTAQGSGWTGHIAEPITDAVSTGNKELIGIKAKEAEAVVAITGADRASQMGHATTASAARVAGSVSAAATSISASRIVGAIQAIPRPVTYVNVDVSANSVTTSQTTTERRSPTSSRTSDRRTGPP